MTKINLRQFHLTHDLTFFGKMDILFEGISRHEKVQCCDRKSYTDILFLDKNNDGKTFLLQINFEN